MFISTTSHISIPTEYFSVRSGQEMDLASEIAMNFIAMNFMLQVFLILIRFEQGSGSSGFASGNVSVNRSN